MFFKDNFLKDIEKLPNKIKLSLEKSKSIDNIDDNNIYKLIKECTEIENNINKIKIINSNINNIYNSKNFEIKFTPDENEINEFIENIKTFGKIKSINNNNIFSKLNSIIKDDKNSIDLIYKWIEESINKNEINFELIFKMSENGTSSKDFHKKCDNQGSTLTLIKTTNNKIFGGFTPLNWKSQGGLINDLKNQTFIFSLNLKKKYKMIKKNGYGIDCAIVYGPNFGNCDFYVEENMKKGASYANQDCSFLSNNNLELIGKKGEFQDFEVDELEVYKVIY